MLWLVRVAKENGQKKHVKALVETLLVVGESVEIMVLLEVAVVVDEAMVHWWVGVVVRRKVLADVGEVKGALTIGLASSARGVLNN